MADTSPDNVDGGRGMHARSARDTAPRLPDVRKPDGADTDLLAWIAPRRDDVERDLCAHGALLLRGFTMRWTADLEALAAIIGGPLMDYRDRATPRRSVSGRVFTSTETPRRYHIPMHNENAFASTWPLRLIFHCIRPADNGGCTPLADARRVCARIDPEVRRRFADRGVLYVRNFGHGPGMQWREAFQVQTREQLEQACDTAGIEYTWLGDDRLRTRQRCRADAVHPRTGEAVWFSHVTSLHMTSLDPTLRDTMLRQLGEENLPHNAYYGDGAPIEATTLDHIRDAYNAEMVRFDWQAGDTLLIDNMLTAHGRDPYEGQRQVVTVLSGPTTWRDIDRPGHGDDVRAVQESSSHVVSSTPPLSAPSTAVGATEIRPLLLAILAEVLEVASVDLDDNFFELGGDSLTATRVISKVRERTNIDLPLAAFFNVSSVRELVDLACDASD